MAMPKTKSRTKAKTRTKAEASAGSCARSGAKAPANAGTGAAAGKAPESAVREVKKEIVAKFPEMKGVRPSVARRRVPAERDVLDLIGQIDGELGARLVGAKGKASMQEIYCASFEKETKTERGTVIRRIVRVTFDRDGHILKLVSSK